MKLPTGNARIIVIVCAIIVLGILFYYGMPGSVLQSGDQKPKGTTTVNSTPAVPLIIDASFEIQEVNVSIIKYISSTPARSYPCTVSRYPLAQHRGSAGQSYPRLYWCGL